jgi:hypothetical protein
MRCLLSAMFFCLSLSLLAQPSLYLPEPIEEAVRIDGLSDDLVWSKAAIAGGFISIRDTWPREWTMLRLVYDSEALYVLAQGSILPGSKVSNRCRSNNDMGVFSDESFEIFLAPNQLLEVDGLRDNTDTYFHFCFNLAGHFYSARKRDRSWQAEGISQKSSLQENYWLMEFRIPFAALQSVTPQPGSSWRANFARNRNGGTENVTSSWSGSSNFHDLKTFGQLHFGKPETWEPATITSLDIRGNQIRCTLQLPENLPNDSTAQILLDQAVVKSSKKIDSLSPGLITLEATLQDMFLFLKGKPKLGLRVFSESTKQGFLDRQANLTWDFQDLFALDKYYYTPEDGKLEFALNPVPSFATDPITKLKIELFDDCHLNSESLLSMDCDSLAGNIALEKLPFGKLYLQASWEQDGNSCRTLRAFQLNEKALKPTKLPANAKLSAKNRQLLLDEKPVFLFAASPSNKHFLQNEECFNLSYGQYGLQENAPRLETLRGGSLLRQEGWIGYTFPPWQQFREMLQKQFQTAASQNCFWRISYEAQMGVACKADDGTLQYMDSPQWYQQVYQELKQISPEKLLSIQVDNLSVAEKFALSCDIFEAAAWSSSYSINLIPHLQRDINSIREACPDKPILLWLGGTIPNPQCRCAEELRAAAFQAVANDMAGIIIHMGHGFLPAERSRLWSMLSNLNAEIQALFQLYQQAGQKIAYPIANTAEFFLAARRTGETLTVIAINQSGGINTLTLPQKADILLPLDNKRKLNRQEDNFSPYEAKVYQIRLQ